MLFNTVGGASSKSLGREQAPVINTWRIAYTEFFNKFNCILTELSNRG